MNVHHERESSLCIWKEDMKQLLLSLNIIIVDIDGLYGVRRGYSKNIINRLKIWVKLSIRGKC